MRNTDLSPLFRSTIGFDRFDTLFNSLLTGAGEQQSTFPPYDIERTGENEYRITMAVAGYSESDLTIILDDSVLSVKGKAEAAEDKTGKTQFLHRGIARRAFERRFHLDDTIRVRGADLQNGLLVIALEREVPEHHRPRQIQIGAAQPAAIEGEQKH